MVKAGWVSLTVIFSTSKAESLYSSPCVKVLRLDPVDALGRGIRWESLEEALQLAFRPLNSLVCALGIAGSKDLSRRFVSALQLPNLSLGVGEEPALLSACRWVSSSAPWMFLFFCSLLCFPSLRFHCESLQTCVFSLRETLRHLGVQPCCSSWLFHAAVSLHSQSTYRNPVSLKPRCCCFWLE